MDCRTERESVDVNITPDKRQVLLQNERFLCALLKKSLTVLYESSPACLPLAPHPLQVGERFNFRRRFQFFGSGSAFI
jgi:DNA mismatch repair protein PMS2